LRRSAGASDEAAKQIDGMKKQAMAKTAEQLLAEEGWLPALL
jgi:ParB family chromosome partitioning protein